METIFFGSVDFLVQGYPPESFSFVEFFTVDMYNLADPL